VSRESAGAMKQTKEDIITYIRSECARWKKELESNDHSTGNITIGASEVLDAHFLLAEYFVNIGDGMGGIGPKEPRLLLSALDRQFVEYGGRSKWDNRLQVCGSLMYGLIKNHPFYDANKRTAFLVSILHLQKIGRTPTATDQEYEDFTVDVADDNLGRYVNRPSEKIRDADVCVNVIAEFLHKNTRDIDLRMKQITFNELQTILGGYGLRLDRPKGNHIDVIRFRDPITKQNVPERRIAHIGFHGWTKEVSRKDIHTIRHAARLDAANGYDSQSFFNGVESPLTLINKYREPLERLAYR